jgi:hypothetical protein
MHYMFGNMFVPYTGDTILLIHPPKVKNENISRRNCRVTPYPSQLSTDPEAKFSFPNMWIVLRLYLVTNCSAERFFFQIETCKKTVRKS